MNVHKGCTVLVYTHDGTAAQGSWGMQPATEMQVIGLMLNRCDSLLERRTGPETQPNTEQELDPPLKSRFQLLMVTMQKTLLLNVTRRRSRPSKGTVCVIHLKQIVCLSSTGSTAAFHVRASGRLSALICPSSQRTRLSSSDSTMLHLHSLHRRVGGI